MSKNVTYLCTFKKPVTFDHRGYVKIELPSSEDLAYLNEDVGNVKSIDLKNPIVNFLDNEVYITLKVDARVD